MQQKWLLPLADPRRRQGVGPTGAGLWKNGGAAHCGRPLSRQTGGGYHAEGPFHQLRPFHRAARRGKRKDTGGRSRQLYQKPTDMGSVHHPE